MAIYMLDVHFSTIFVARLRPRAMNFALEGQESIPKDFQEPTVSKNEGRVEETIPDFTGQAFSAQQLCSVISCIL